MRKLGEETGEFLQRKNLKRRVMSRSLTIDFILFSLFIFYFTFILLLFFIFLFLEQLGLGFISHAVTASHKVMA